MSNAPPPPPRHGENPRTTAGGSGLPNGKYDIFIIPEHSAGSGFLYLPSLKPRWNSFLAGVAVTLLVVMIGNSLAPALQIWWANFTGFGNFGAIAIAAVVGIGGFLAGNNQKSSDKPSGGERYQPSGGGGGYGSGGSGGYYNTPPPNGGPRPSQAPPPNQPPPPPPPQPETPRTEKPHQSWQEQPQQHQESPRPQPQQAPPPPPPPEPEPEREQPKPQPQPKPQAKPQPQTAPRPTPQAAPPPRPSPTKTDTKGAWEKAREETRRREEERKAKEAEQKRKEDQQRRLRELREREAREREQRERDSRDKETKERERKEQEARERARLEKELREKVERELREKVERETRETQERLAKEAREREARERLVREAREREERERQAKERAAELLRMREEERQRVETERRERELKEAREREAKEARERKERLERMERDRLERERLERERQRKEEEEKNARKGSSYAYASMGEKTSMWPNGKPPAPSQAASSPSGVRQSPSPTKPTAASARAADTEEEAYSFRPYDKPKKPTARKKSVSDFSESSWAPSASTARTTPPPSMRGPYTTSDPDKIIIKAVYGFVNQFSKTPATQLVSGVGTVTDGLILRITSAGLFVDDDVRGMAQREWDVKAWTVKNIEVWCPTHALNSAASNTPGSVPTNHPFFKSMPSTARRAAERGATKTFVGEEAVAYLEELGRGCRNVCQHGLSGSAKSSVSGSSNSNKTGEWASKGLHVLRVQLRDAEGKRYLFVVDDEQAWKISKGLSTLRSSGQVRALSFAGLSGLEAKGILETLGWS
ncbi:hypothetical protein B0T16DRAFT_390375 [Cercophora newfieldiana]|uniref:Uncharacterized protein n=1 Tax=Cercophora newfieldiana TaxID=92897 RepID=A0AA39Y501_9PEZI|nr:hypothetical protein B0T16DRAFT_390375 [Cercophora newfieldiana]